MPIKKWILQYVLMIAVLFVAFAGVQVIKGRGLNYALEFGLIWSLVSCSIFMLVRIRNYNKRIACKLCNDLPQR